MGKITVPSNYWKSCRFHGITLLRAKFHSPLKFSLYFRFFSRTLLEWELRCQSPWGKTHKFHSIIRGEIYIVEADNFRISSFYDSAFLNLLTESVYTFWDNTILSFVRAQPQIIFRSYSFYMQAITHNVIRVLSAKDCTVDPSRNTSRMRSIFFPHFLTFLCHIYE